VEVQSMKRKGFTLIELLIVVAIIGILAAIAVPNFMNAQVRAKVSRAVSDMKNIATALEMYHLDHNGYPMARSNPITGETGQIKLSHRFYPLTTPVSYMSSIASDPFFNDLMEVDPSFFDTYDYFDDWSTVNYDKGVKGSGTRGFSWRLASAGPDGIQCWGGLNCSKNGRTGIDYDLTNGVVSDGDIVTTGGTIVNAALVVKYPLP
jgi:type II secretion system protein G